MLNSVSARSLTSAHGPAPAFATRAKVESLYSQNANRAGVANSGRVKRITSEEQLRAERIVAFTFRDTVDECLELWFGKSSHTDTEIWQMFGDDVRRATLGELDHWATDVDHPRMFLALIILLDQFRRNMYRETADMYGADKRCVALVKAAIRNGMIEKLQLVERAFPCLVLTHSETLSDQHLCMDEWQKVEQDLTPTDPLRVFREVFERHVAVIEDYGRFPHRNKLLGRKSTAAEAEFLADANFRFDLPLVKRSDGRFCFQGEIKGHPVNQVAGKTVNLTFKNPDAVLTQAEQEIRLKGYADIHEVRLRKFIVERDMPRIGSVAYRKIKAEIDNANKAMEMLWPRMSWVESFVCNDKTFCVYLADGEDTLIAHALLSGMPMSSINEVKSIVDPNGFDRDLERVVGQV